MRFFSTVIPYHYIPCSVRPAFSDRNGIVAVRTLLTWHGQDYNNCFKASVTGQVVTASGCLLQAADAACESALSHDIAAQSVSELPVIDLDDIREVIARLERVYPRQHGDKMGGHVSVQRHGTAACSIRFHVASACDAVNDEAPLELCIIAKPKPYPFLFLEQICQFTHKVTLLQMYPPE